MICHFFFLGHGIIFFCVYFTQVWGLWSPRSNPRWSAADGKSDWVTLCEHPAAPAEGCGWTGAAPSAHVWMENRTKLSRASLGGLMECLFGFCLHEARLQREVFFDGKIQSLSNSVSQRRVGRRFVIDNLTFLELHSKTLMWKQVIHTLDGRSSSRPPQMWFSYPVSRYCKDSGLKRVDLGYRGFWRPELRWMICKELFQGLLGCFLMS